MAEEIRASNKAEAEKLSVKLGEVDIPEDKKSWMIFVRRDKGKGIVIAQPLVNKKLSPEVVAEREKAKAEKKKKAEEKKEKAKAKKEAEAKKKAEEKAQKEAERTKKKAEADKEKKAKLEAKAKELLEKSKKL